MEWDTVDPPPQTYIVYGSGVPSRQTVYAYWLIDELAPRETMHFRFSVRPLTSAEEAAPLLQVNLYRPPALEATPCLRGPYVSYRRPDDSGGTILIPSASTSRAFPLPTSASEPTILRPLGGSIDRERARGRYPEEFVDEVLERERRIEEMLDFWSSHLIP